jgi:glycosyltransferase involved in cell wall biosynthesis
MDEMSELDSIHMFRATTQPIAPAGTGIELSVVLPVYDEHQGLGTLLSELVETLSPQLSSFEVIVVDDGSSGATQAALRAAQERHPQVIRVARHLRNRGNGAALRTGIRLAKGELVITMDSDGQHDPGDIAKLLGRIPPFDLVIGARTRTYRGPWLRRMANAFYNGFASWLTRRNIADLTSGFRAMRREVVNHFLPLFPNGFSAPTTTTLAFLKAGYNVAFVPIEVGRRSSGRSKIRLWQDGINFVVIIVRIVMQYDPLRIFVPVAIGLGLLGLTAWVAGLLNAARLVIPNSAVFLLSAALMTWLLGLISDQIASSRIQYHGDETVELYQMAAGEDTSAS